MRRAPSAALLALASICGGFAPPAPQRESIEMSRRPWFFICAGVCPNYDVIVQPNGRVWVIRRYFDAVDAIRRFRISPARLARLRAMLEPLRPNDGTPEPAECRHDLPPDQAELVVKTVEMEVKWTGPDGSYHLVGCATPEYTAMRETMGAALELLGLDVSAYPLE